MFVIVTDSGGVGGASRDVILNNLPTNSGEIDDRVDVTSQLVSPILGIGVNGRGVFQAIVVDGKRLVNSDDGIVSTHVEYQTTGGKGKLVATNTDDNTIMLSDDPGATRNNRWIKGSIDIDGNAGNSGETGTGAKDFYVAGGQKSDDPTLTADIRLQCSEFATTPENVDTLKNIIWEINGSQ